MHRRTTWDSLWLGLWVCLLLGPATLAAQAPERPGSPAQEEPTGNPPGVAATTSRNSRGFPAPITEEGKPIESRPPEKADDKPLFPGQTRAPYLATTAVNVTTLTDKLKLAWSFAFLQSGKILILEKGGAMRLLDASGALSEPLAGVPAVSMIGQAGLLDVALDPQFATSQEIFFTFTEPVGENYSALVVARARLDEGSGALTGAKVIFRAKPALPRTLSSQTGGRMVFGRDGNLFVAIGDRSKSPPWDMAQKLDTHLGKTIHITRDGAPAPGNPFIGKAGALPEIWSYGHRNPQGLTVDPASGDLWEVEHGPRGGDELNKIEAGKNFGWPVAVHGIDYSGDPVGKGITAQAGVDQPRYYWDPVIAPSGLVFYTGNLFPRWKGSVLVGALRGMLLDRLTVSDAKVVTEEPLLVDQHSRIRDVRVDPQGTVYVLTDGDKLLKLTPR